MTLEEVAKFCQRQLETVPLLIIGSGASAAHGLPTMGALAQHLIDHLNYPAASEEYDQWQEFKQQLNQEWDLEKALNVVAVNSRVLDDIIVNTWNCINEADSNVYYDLVSRKIELPLAKLIRWLMAKANPKLSIITTNYDKLVEYSAGLNKSNIYTGFANSVFGNLNAGRSHATSLKCEGLEGQIDIWKVHGSLDWFRTNCSSIQSLQINDLTKAQVKPLIVTPGVSKYYETHKDPFRTIMTNSDREITSGLINRGE